MESIVTIYLLYCPVWVVKWHELLDCYRRASNSLATYTCKMDCVTTPLKIIPNIYRKECLHFAAGRWILAAKMKLLIIKEGEIRNFFFIN